MARERTIACGDHDFTTRANPRVFVRCPHCGRGHRAPPIGDPWRGPQAPPGAPEESHEAADSFADLAEIVLPAPASSLVKITRAAHSTAHKAENATKATKKAPSKRRSAPRPMTKAQQAGRRGGRADRRPDFLRRVGR